MASPHSRPVRSAPASDAPVDVPAKSPSQQANSRARSNAARACGEPRRSNAWAWCGPNAPRDAWAHFEKTGRIEWVTDLSEIPGKYGVNNVYGELGACFANTCITHPRLAAALMGTLMKGLGTDRILWGTDSVWWGSPQWQIEAMRRLTD